MTDRTPHPTVDPTTAGAAPPGTATTRTVGAVLAVGALSWGVAQIVVGENVQAGVQPFDMATGAVYALGLSGLTVLLARVGATGRRAGRFLPRLAAPVLLGAVLANLLSLVHGGAYEHLPPVLQVLDACWPLGQLLLLATGIAVAVAGRLRGALRVLPLLCGLWFPVSTAAQILLGPADSVYVSATWLALTPAALGLQLLLRPDTLQAAG